MTEDDRDKNRMINMAIILALLNGPKTKSTANKRQGLPDIIAGRPEITGAGNEIRTRDPRLGKPVLYH